MSKRKTLSKNLIGNLLGLKIKITMRYYITDKIGRRRTTTKENFYSLKRSKKRREKVWINGGVVVARELIEQ